MEDSIEVRLAWLEKELELVQRYKRQFEEGLITEAHTENLIAHSGRRIEQVFTDMKGVGT